MAKVKVKCKHCKEEFEARQADINRGWGKFCSKSCKAKHQEKRTGQYKNYLINKKRRRFVDAMEHCGDSLGFYANYSNEDDGDNI